MVKEYLKPMEDKYLVSGPAPLGRILNYIKRIQEGAYKTSKRGPQSSDNLDDWTVCFMVGLGLIEEPTYSHILKINLTDGGKLIYENIKELPPFPDDLNRAKFNMLEIKDGLKKNNPTLYELLKEVILKSIPLQNLSIYFQNKNISSVSKQDFYDDFGGEFNIMGAGFNRLPSLLQCAEFCDILVEENSNIKIYDPYYIKNEQILNDDEFIEREIKKKKIIEKGKITEEDEDMEKDFIGDTSKELTPKKRKIVIEQNYRDQKKAKKLKNYYENACQICGKPGFKKKDGNLYSEAHHLIPLGEDGSDDYSNLIVVCPDCHRKLHYADIEMGKLTDHKRKINIIGEESHIIYKPDHSKIIKE